MGQLASATDLLRTARVRTGFNELGNGRFFAALDQLVHSINTESQVSADGLQATHERLLRLLVNRLRFQADLIRHPEILAERLLPPLVICGLPRVGSTKLHQLLAKSGDFQALLFWQGLSFILACIVIVLFAYRGR